MNYPRITIITPSFNQGKYLEDTILSVLGQFYSNLEYMIYDGGSTDNSVNIIKKYEDKLSFWVSEKDKGQSDAINKGFLRSTGEILMWLNSDDMLMPNVLNFIAKQYLEHGDGIYFANCLHFNEIPGQGILANGSNVINKYSSISLELVDIIIQPSTFWSKNVWLLNGELDENFHFGFDWEWFLRAKGKNIRFYPLNKPLSLYRIHDEHKSGIGGEKRQNELMKIYEKYNVKYAQLYSLIRSESFQLSKAEKILFTLSRFLFNKNISKADMIKKKNKNLYKEFTAEEISFIKSML